MHFKCHPFTYTPLGLVSALKHFDLQRYKEFTMDDKLYSHDYSLVESHAENRATLHIIYVLFF